MRAGLANLIDEAAADDNIDSVVFVGAGQAFSAGQDFNEVLSWDENTDWISEIRDLYLQVLTFPKPTVAAVNGVAAGSGLQFALLCDYRVASETARMGQTEVRWGLASVTGTWLLEETVGPLRARTLALSAALLPAPQLLAEGLVDEVAAADQVLAAATARATELASHPRATYMATKKWCFDRLRPRFDRAFDDAHRLHRDAFAEGVSTAGAAAFLARNRPATDAAAGRNDLLGTPIPCSRSLMP